MRINYKTSLAIAAGLLVMAVAAQRVHDVVHAAVTIASTNVPKTIIDVGTVTSTLNFTVTGTTTDVDISNLNITHTWDGDVEVSLSRPAGALVLIIGDCSGTDDNFVNVTFSDQGAATNCVADGLPFTGVIRGAPNGVSNATVMQAFNAISSGGIWTMSIFDDVGGDTGTLSSWSITADGPPPLPVELLKMEVN